MLHWQRALLWHGLGFAILLVLTWCDALFDLMHILLGYPPKSANPGEVAFKTAVVFLLWVWSAYKLYQIVSRLSYLENFVRVCAWCRRIEHGEKWLSLEEHFQQRSGSAVTHGICPDCAKNYKQQAAVA